MSQSRHEHHPGQFIARHSHEGHQLLFVERGVLAIETAHRIWVAGPLRAVWVPAQVEHEVRVHGSTVVHTLEFGFAPSTLSEDRPRVVAVRPLLRELVLAATTPGLGAEEVERLHAVVLDQVTRSESHGLVLPVAADPRLADACALVRADLSITRGLPDVAVAVRSSPRTLARLFRDEFDMTYAQWRTAARTYAAMVLLAGGATVTTTAHACGWSTPSAFVDSFKRATGRTPGQYQRLDDSSGRSAEDLPA